MAMVTASNGVEVPLIRCLGSYRVGVDIVHKMQFWVGEGQGPGGEPIAIRWVGHEEWQAMVGLSDG